MQTSITWVPNNALTVQWSTPNKQAVIEVEKSINHTQAHTHRPYDETLWDNWWRDLFFYWIFTLEFEEVFYEKRSHLNAALDQQIKISTANENSNNK